MKKIVSFLIACALFAITITVIADVINVEYKDVISRSGKILCYENNSVKSNCPEVLEEVLDDNTIVMLGSSELPYYDEKSHPEIITNHGNSDFNIMMIGVGNVQSLMHTINAGGLEPYMKNKKIVLNLSPQWFSEGGIAPDAFSSRFSPRMLDSFMSNPHLSDDLKKRVLVRCEELFVSYPEGQKQVDSYKKQTNGEFQNPIEALTRGLTNSFSTLQSKKSIIDLDLKSYEEEYIEFDKVDYYVLMSEAQKQGEEECTNNEFYIYDEYYDKYIKPNLQDLKDSMCNYSYSQSPEYNDLELFLDVCEELRLDVMLINVPVNGYWYDYAGFPKSEREEYYQKIRIIAENHGVQLLDLSEHEYTPYFLKDIMHLGWKGWVYIDEGIYRFYKEN